MPEPIPLRPQPIEHRLEVVAYGLPTAQGSKSHVGNGIMVESGGAKLRTWREDVKLAALAAIDTHPTWRGDYAQLVGRFTFTLPRPRDHYRTGKYAEILRDNAPLFHSKRPDLDKLLRSTWDALTTAGVYEDDSKLVRIIALKTFPRTYYGLPVPGVRIQLATAPGVDRYADRDAT